MRGRAGRKGETKNFQEESKEEVGETQEKCFQLGIFLGEGFQETQGGSWVNAMMTESQCEAVLKLTKTYQRDALNHNGGASLSTSWTPPRAMKSPVTTV